jgi:hypothetical protein
MTSLAAYNIISDGHLRLAAEQLRGLTGTKKGHSAIRHRVGESVKISDVKLEAPPGFEPGMEVLQISQENVCC